MGGGTIIEVMATCGSPSSKTCYRTTSGSPSRAASSCGPSGQLLAARPELKTHLTVPEPEELEDGTRLIEAVWQGRAADYVTSRTSCP